MSSLELFEKLIKNSQHNISVIKKVNKCVFCDEEIRDIFMCHSCYLERYVYPRRKKLSQINHSDILY